MNVEEFVKRVKRLARKTQTPCRFGPLKRELPTGTLHAMLRQLGITAETFSEE